MLAGDVAARDAVRPTGIERLSILVSTPDLAGATMELPRLPGSETRLREALEPLRDDYAFILLDCPPSLGPLTVNALVAAERVIVPVQTEYFALEGLAGLLDTLSLIQRELNPRLTVAGMLLTMHDARTKLAQDVEREVRSHFPALVFDTVIPRNVRLGEAPSYGIPVIHHDPHCAGRRPTSSSPRRWPPVAERQRGMGRGLAAILSPTIPPEGSEATPELRRAPDRADRPQPAPAAAELRRGVAARALGVGPRARRPAARARPALPGRLLRADRRRAPLARRPARGPRRRCPPSSRPHEDRESLELALIENMAREDLNPIEEARACSLLVDELGLTREEVGRRVGRSRVAVSNLLRLLDLPDEVLDLLVEGRLTEGHGRALLMAPDHADRRRLGRAAADEGWTVRETEARAREAARPPEVAPQAAPRRSTRTSSPPPSASRTLLARPRRRRPRRPPQRGLHRHARGRLAREAEALAERLSFRAAAGD